MDFQPAPDFQGSMFLRREDGRSFQQVFVELKDGHLVVHKGDQVDFSL